MKLVVDLQAIIKTYPARPIDLIVETDGSIETFSVRLL
jgi:hypothetical protein